MCEIYFLEYKGVRFFIDLFEIGFWKGMCLKFILRGLFEGGIFKCILGN